MRWWSGTALRLRRIDPVAADVVLAVVIAALSLAQLARPPVTIGPRPGDVLGGVLVVVLCGLLAVRRFRSRVVLVAVLAVTLAYVLLGYPQTVLGLPLLVAVFTVGSAHGLRASAGVLAAVVAVVVVAFAVDPGPVAVVDLVATVVTVGGAWWVGATVRMRREQVALVEERAALLERARQDVADRAVTQERLRIARELHDVVAHSMSVVAVQSGMAEHVLATQPERAGAALAAISESSRSALTELRRLLGVLRDDDEPAGDLAPALGVADLPALVERATAAGLRTDLSITGDPATVPAGAGLTVYRIVQEALTNVVRHGGPGTSAGVSVTCGSGAVDLLIVDDGAGTPAAAAEGTGSGLLGMRERVEVFDGELDAGPAEAGGWQVAARLPLDPPGARASGPLAGRHPSGAQVSGPGVERT